MYLVDSTKVLRSLLPSPIFADGFTASPSQTQALRQQAAHQPDIINELYYWSDHKTKQTKCAQKIPHNPYLYRDSMTIDQSNSIHRIIGVDGRRIAAFAVADVSMVLRREEEVVSDRGVGLLRLYLLAMLVAHM
jgi:hypothetical protein